MVFHILQANTIAFDQPSLACSLKNFQIKSNVNLPDSLTSSGAEHSKLSNEKSLRMLAW